MRIIRLPYSMHFFQRFWQWYEKHYLLNISIAAGLFILQIIHLAWLFGDVIMMRLFGQPLIMLSGAFEYLVIAVDYTEIPAIITTSLVYINEIRKRVSWKPILYLLFLNSQWLHLFWITDEFVVTVFTDSTMSILPVWLAWVAILIDYLELPVIIDTLYKLFKALKEKRLKNSVAHILREQ